MAQLSSNTMAYQQMMQKVARLVAAINSSSILTKEQIVEEYMKILTEIKNDLGAPMTKYDALIKGEPPRSEKINSFFINCTQDMSIVSRQIDYLNAKTINIFNLFSAEVENEKRYSERIASKCKILQMYSRSPSDDLVYIGDSFENDDLFDYSKIKKGLNPLVRSGMASLPITSSKKWQVTSVEVVGGNGFIGNSHEVVKSLNSDGTSEYRYVFESSRTINNLRSIIDGSPLSYFEYESLNVDKFSSRSPSTIPAQENEFKYLKTELNSSNANESNLVDWSTHPVNNPLTLKLRLSSNSAKVANCIDITPYFGSSKYVEVEEVVVYSKDGSSENVLKNKIYIGSSLVPLNIELARDYYYNKATVRFSEREIIKVEISFRQPNHNNIEIRHVYWKPSSLNSDNPFVNLDRFNPDVLSRDIYEIIQYNKYELLPTISNPIRYKTTTENIADVDVTLKKKPTLTKAWFIQATMLKQDNTTQDLFFNKWLIQFDSVFDDKREAEFVSEIEKDDDSFITKNYPSPSDAQADLDDLLEKYVSDSATPYTLEGVGILQNITLVERSFTPVEKEVKHRVLLQQQGEIYSAKRWAVGLRDIDIYQESYKDETEIVSLPFRFDFPVESVMLSLDASLDQRFSNRTLIETYISVDQGANWIQISPIQLDFNGIPEVIFFNQSILNEYRLSGASYLSYPSVPKEIKDVTVKIVMKKNSSYNYSPYLYSYQLVAKVKRS